MSSPKQNAGWARELGLMAFVHIGMASAGTDGRIAHQYHEDRAVRLARRAAHYAHLAEPSLRSNEPRRLVSGIPLAPFESSDPEDCR